MPITARPNRLTANYMARNCRLYVTLFCFSVFVCFCVFDSNTVLFYAERHGKYTFLRKLIVSVFLNLFFTDNLF